MFSQQNAAMPQLGMMMPTFYYPGMMIPYLNIYPMFATQTLPSISSAVRSGINELPTGRKRSTGPSNSGIPNKKTRLEIIIEPNQDQPHSILLNDSIIPTFDEDQNNYSASPEEVHVSKIILDLPNETLGKIFEYVSFDDLFNLERVNKRIQFVVIKIAWTKIQRFDHESIVKFTTNPKIHEMEAEPSNNMVKAVLSRTMNKLKHFDVSVYYGTITKNICLFLPMMPQLCSLSLSFIKLTNKDLITIAKGCSLLEKIHFKKCFKTNMESGLEFLFKQCPKIKCLNLDVCNLTGECFKYISKKLRFLKVKSRNLTSNSMELLAEKASNLETLILFKFFATKDVNVWLQKLKKLRFLEIWEIRSLVQSLPPLILSKMKELSMLRVRDGGLITLESIQSLSLCPKLEVIDITYNYNYNPIQPYEALKSCRALKYCVFSGLHYVNDLVDFVKNSSIKYLAINDRYFNLPENIWKSLVTECTSLCHLELRGISENLTTFLTENYQTRPSILKLFVSEGKEEILSCEWCDVYIQTKNNLSPLTSWISKMIEKTQKKF